MKECPFEVEWIPRGDNLRHMVATLSPRSRAEVKKEVKAIRKAGREIGKSKESTRAWLLKHGYITKDNQLPERYR